MNITGALPIPSADMTGEVVGIAINTTGCGKNALYWQVNSGVNPNECEAASMQELYVCMYCLHCVIAFIML